LERLYQTLQPLILPPMGSVGLTAIQLALALAAPHLPVLHTGLDFAWQTGLTHAAGSSPIKKLFAEICRTESPYKLSVSTGMQHIVGKKGVSYWTTPVLSGYAELYRHAFSGNERVIDIGTEGCFLNGRQADITEAEQILTDAGKSNINADGNLFDSACKSDTANERYEALNAYLAGEADALTMLNDHLQGKRSISEHMMEQLFAERDYLYSHFPDATRSYSLDLGFLKRAGIELRYLLKILS